MSAEQDKLGAKEILEEKSEEQKREEYLAKRREYYAKNRKKIRERDNEAARRHRKEDPERFRAYNEKWREKRKSLNLPSHVDPKKHPDKIRIAYAITMDEMKRRDEREKLEKKLKELGEI